MTGWNDEYIDLIRDDPGRTMMGPRQEKWFYKSLSESKDRATWRIVGNQLIFSHMYQNDDGDMSIDNWNVRIMALLQTRQLLTRPGLYCEPQQDAEAPVRQRYRQQHLPRRRFSPELGKYMTLQTISHGN